MAGRHIHIFPVAIHLVLYCITTLPYLNPTIYAYVCCDGSFPFFLFFSLIQQFLFSIAPLRLPTTFFFIYNTFACKTNIIL